MFHIFIFFIDRDVITEEEVIKLWMERIYNPEKRKMAVEMCKVSSGLRSYELGCSSNKLNIKCWFWVHKRAFLCLP